MKIKQRIQIALLWGIFLSLTASKLQAQDALPALVRKIKPSVVTILNYNSSRLWPNYGTGFFVAPDRIVTARHVAAGAQYLDIKTVDGRYYRVKGVLADSPNYDLLLLQLETSPPGVQPLTFAPQLPEEGERLFEIGSPQGLEWTVADGIVASIRDIPELGQMIQHAVPSYFGNSGGPLFNLKGQVVGVHASGITGVGVSGYSIPAKHVSELVKRATSQATSIALWGKDVPPDWKAPSTSNTDFASLRPLILGNAAKSLPFFQAGVERNPQDPNAWFFLGWCYHSAGNLEKAVETYRKVIEIKADFPNAQGRLGQALQQQSKTNEAIESLLKELQINPQNYVAYSLAAIHLNLKDYNAAVKYGREAVRLNTTDAPSHHVLGTAYFRLNLFQEAANELDLAAKLADKQDGIFITALADLSRAYNKLGQFANALNVLNQAALVSKESWLDVEMGQAYLLRGENTSVRTEKEQSYSQALESLQKAVTANPRNATARYFLGFTLFRLNRLSEASSALEQVVAQYKELDVEHQDDLFFYQGIVAMERAKAEADPKKQKDFYLRAAESLRSSIQVTREPNNAPYYLALVYAALMRWDSSLSAKILEQYRALKASDPQKAKELRGQLPFGVKVLIQQAEE